MCPGGTGPASLDTGWTPGKQQMEVPRPASDKKMPVNRWGKITYSIIISLKGNTKEMATEINKCERTG